MIQAPKRIELPTLFGMGTVNAWLFIDPIPTLIDCGEHTDDSHDALLAGLSSFGLSINDVEQVIITHAHVDHIGNLSRVVTESNADVLTNPICYPWTWRSDTMLQDRLIFICDAMTRYMGHDAPMIKAFRDYFSYLHLIWPPAPKGQIKVLPWNACIALGGSQWKNVYTPGHCNHIGVLYDADQQRMLSSDTLLQMVSTPVLESSLDDQKDVAQNLSATINTLKELGKINIKHAFPGHYETIFDPEKTIKNQIYRIELRLSHVYDLISDGASRFNDIFQELYGSKSNFPGVWMLIGYLQVLEERQLISSVNVNGLLSFRIIKK